MQSTASAAIKPEPKSVSSMTTSEPPPLEALPRVSVVIPAYNAEDTLERAIRTVLDQTVAPQEVIVVDDASTDGTRTLVETLAANDPRIRLIASSPNAGPAHCRNLGFRAAEGDWIAIQDADDAWSPDRLEKMLAAAYEHRADLVADNMLFYDIGCDEIIRTGFPTERGLRWITAQDLFEQDAQLGSEFGFGLLQPMIRKAFLTDHGLAYGSLRYGEDMVFLAEVLFAGARAVLIPDPLYICTTRVGERSGVENPHSKSIPRFDLIADQIDALKAAHAQSATAETRRAMTKLADRYRVVHALNLARLKRSQAGIVWYLLHVGARPPLLAHFVRQRVNKILLDRRLSRPSVRTAP
jgi:succinoglycan biosynthesis protein ExoO